MERGGSVCNIAESPVENKPATSGTCPAWSGPPVAVIHVVSSIEQAAILVVMGTCTAWSGPEVAVIHAVSSIEQKTIPVLLGKCPA